jgi:hypothetical protein
MRAAKNRTGGNTTQSPALGKAEAAALGKAVGCEGMEEEEEEEDGKAAQNERRQSIAWKGRAFVRG